MGIVMKSKNESYLDIMRYQYDIQIYRAQKWSFLTEYGRKATKEYEGNGHVWVHWSIFFVGLQMAINIAYDRLKIRKFFICKKGKRPN